MTPVSNAIQSTRSFDMPREHPSAPVFRFDEELARRVEADEALWAIVGRGDLAPLTPLQKAEYYRYKCQQMRVDAAQMPFTYIKFQGTERLYGNKNLADQLRGVHGVSFHDITIDRTPDFIRVLGYARDRSGREDFDIGVVAVTGARGPGLANAEMTAVTKFKRRVTFSLCSAGVSDESDAEGGVVVSQFDPATMQVKITESATTEEDVPAAGEPVLSVVEQKNALGEEIRGLRLALGYSEDDIRQDAKARGFDLRLIPDLATIRDELARQLQQRDQAIDDTDEAIEAEFSDEREEAVF